MRKITSLLFGVELPSVNSAIWQSLSCVLCLISESSQMEEFRGLSTQKDESLGTSFALNKESSKNDLLRYFKAILKLQKLNESFPVNIDEVWMLVYTNRNKAIYSLRSNFIEGEDFDLYQMGKVVSSKELRNGIKIDAKLSVSCMEYFVARKSRSVFDVYRKVFHKAAEILQEPLLITSKQINAKISWIKVVRACSVSTKIQRFCC